MSFDIQEELKKLPARPGVYLMHDKEDNIIYVGKAVKLCNRVRQYFQSSRNQTAKIRQMVSHVAYFEYIVTDTEVEALVLECNLIKEHHPKYNTMLTDDKAYPFIKVTLQEAFPRFMMARQAKKDKAKYFGPYTSAGAVKDSLEMIHKIYQIRTCNRVLPRDTGKERACLYYHIHQCLGPCQGNVTREEYHTQVKAALEFLGGNYGKVEEYLKNRMEQSAARMEYETAAEFRDLLESIKRLSQKQKITEAGGQEDRDVLAFAQDKNEAVMQVFFIRNGKLIGREHFYLTGVEQEEEGEILGSFLKQYYAGTPFIPEELMLPCVPEEADLLEKWLTLKRGGKVTLRIPKIGQKEKLVELAGENAKMVLEKDRAKLIRENQRTVGAVEEIAKLLGLPRVLRMESYDISNISGFESVGSMVVFEEGRPKKADYRKFRIQTVKGPDDYASLREVLTRRFTHGLREKEELEEENLGRFTRFPDLILMDGGKGQVKVALEVEQELGLTIPVCGMVKNEHHQTRGIYFEGIEIPIDTHSEGFHLITRIQDETHRFAITYHRSLRSKNQVHSVLDDIKGIGPARRKALMQAFPSLEDIRTAKMEELREIPTMNQESAKAVYDFFH